MKCLKITLILFTSIFIFKSGLAQGQYRFQTSFGGNNSDGIVLQNFTKPLVRKANENFLCLGSTRSFGNQRLELVVSEVDGKGNIVWSKTYGSDSAELAFSITKASEGYLIAGRTQGFGPGIQGYLVKIDSMGNQLWSKAYQANGNTIAVSAKETSDGGLLTIGITGSSNNTRSNLHVMKMDENQNVQWEKVVGTSSEASFGWDFTEVSDGYIITGQLGAIGTNSDGQLVKISNNGNIEWRNRYSFSGLMAFKDIEVYKDHLYLFGLVEGSSLDEAVVLKMDMMGNIDWANGYGRDGVLDRAVSGTVNNGKVALYGVSGIGGSLDVLLAEIDTSGDILFTGVRENF